MKQIQVPTPLEFPRGIPYTLASDLSLQAVQVTHMWDSQARYLTPLSHLQAVLADHKKCPFTSQQLSWEQCTVLTHSNIERFRDRIIS